MIVSTEIGGKWYRVLVPNDAPESSWKYGVMVGPPDFEDILPADLALRLHNELFNRGLITQRDIKGHADSVLGAWQAVLKVDYTSIVAKYHE